MYVCGPTVDNLPHIGHGRFNLTYDILRRYLLFNGFEVDYVSNVTDIDDKIITRAGEEGRSEEKVVEQFEGAWFEAMDGLGVLRPTSTPHATAYVEDMVQLVADLVGRGVAYETSDGVYLNVEQVQGYGLLARQSLDSLRSGARVESTEEKRSPLDFALVEEGQAGRAHLGVALGARATGLAHRVCRHVARSARRGLRPPRRRHRPDLPPSRERAGPGGGAGSGVRPLLGAQRLGDGRRHQDVQVARQLHHPPRFSGPPRCPGVSAAGAPCPLPLADRGHPRARWPTPRRASNGSTPWPAGSPWAGCCRGTAGRATWSREHRPRPGSTRTPCPPSAPAWTTTSIRPAALAGIFDLVTAAHTSADAGDVERGTASRPVGRGAGAPPWDCRSVTTKPSSTRRRPAWWPSATRPGGPRDFQRADALRDELTARGWTVEDTPDGTAIRR